MGETMIQPQLIGGMLIMPENVRYDRKGVWAGNKFIPSANPRLTFACMLSGFVDDSGMEPYNGSFVRNNTVVGKCRIGIGCVIGGAGFGYEVESNGSLFHVPHLGKVVIGDNVVIHNNVCIDRAVIGETIIGNGTVIDNLVHIAHNVKIGKNCQIVAHAIIGGSVELGDNVFIGMNASIKNKVRIGNNVIVGAGAVVLRDIPDDETWVGNPAKQLVKS